MIRAVLVLAAVLLAAGCGTDCTPAPGTADRPNVVLVTIDTLRADHVGAYGGHAVATPTLDRLAAEGLLFEHAFAQTHVTVPSHLSIMSSLPASTHGVTTNAETLPAGVRPATLPAVLRAAGWRTAGVVGAKHLGPGWALGDLLAPSLEHFDVPERLSEPRHATAVTDAAVAWIRGACRAPFFLWVHYWDPHMPYEPPPEWLATTWGGDPEDAAALSMADVRLGWSAYDLRDVRAALAPDAAAVRALKRDFGLRTKEVRRLLEFPAGEAITRRDPDGTRHLAERLRDLGIRTRGRLPFKQPEFAWLTGVRDVRYPRAAYAAEVAYTDAQLGRLRAALEEMHLGARTVVLVTADHGESLGEHGVWFQHVGIYEPNLRIPLVVWAPGRIAPGRRAEPVDLLDVAPTLLAAAGMPVPADMRGRDLRQVPLPPRLLVTDSAKGGQRAVREGPWKLIHTFADVWSGDAVWRPPGSLELYDLAADPGESDDRTAADRARAGRLDAALAGWMAAESAAGPARAVDPERASALRALGYTE